MNSFTLQNRRIAVLMGGPGSEREVSIWSGEAVAKALEKGGAEVILCDLHDAQFTLPQDIDIAFNVIHGTFGEDGQLQALLEEHGISYTGEGVKGSRLAFDKILSKKRFVEEGIPTPLFEIIQRGERPKMKVPYVIKPPQQGSTVGIHIIKEDHESTITEALQDAFQYGDELLVEEFFPGKELTVGILGDKALPIIEIRPHEGFYDYKHKYTKGASDYLVPAPLEALQTEEIQKIALAAHRSLGLAIYSRVDIMLTEDGRIGVLEINTIPGMTETSLLPKAAAVSGLDFTALCAKIIELSLAIRSKAE
ncbi:MAG: D-alanine--D-alanine ligase [Verrucomicrobia bacterium RIFCSPHIGHO2_12_FULL_41_10]|nr:MAG: D-alanine--D-alanine ligase [Verrucomicrobia bacterium RIFCSPHIGHO2_12_FULL_41_10]HLB34569.1 D-alanine--D-alanine ligase [Chthoniobacterales bacterium]